MKRYLFALVALGLSGCLRGGDDTCTATLVTPIEGFSGPKTAAVNQTVTFKLNYILQNGCGKFLDLVEQTTTNPAGDDVRLISVRATYDGCVCTQVVIPTQATYTFVPTKAGTYYVNFIANTATNVLTDTLVVK